MDNLQYGDFQLEKFLGMGSTALVYKCKHKVTNQVMAMKKIEFSTDSSEQTKIEVGLFEDESRILKSLSHKNIVKLIASFRNETHGFIMTEWMSFDLAHFTDQRANGLDMNKIKHLGRQILEAIDYLHDLGVWHRDVKPKNILLGEDGNVKLADFGLAKNVLVKGIENLSLDVVTPYFKAPELEMLEPNYTNAIDCWSYGVCFFYMVSGKYLFKPEESEETVLEAIYRIRGTQNETTWPGYDKLPGSKKFDSVYLTKDWKTVISKLEDQEDAIQVLDGSLQCCPAKRMSANELLKLKFFGTR